MASGYRYILSQEPEDKEWDSFLAQTPGGHHAQTSLWAQVKSTLGWNAVRIVVKQEARVVGGAQISMRRFLPGGTVGIVSKGPLLLAEDPLLANLMVDALLRVSKEHGVSCLVVQPPNNGETVTQSMSVTGFRPLALEVAPTASIQIDLKQDLDDILAAMKKQTRRDIRHGLRCGLKFREGTEDELATFWRLLKATSQRQSWSIYSESYYREILRVYGQRGLAKLFFTEYEGKAVSSQILIAFGDTVIAKNSGWSGQFKSLGPNNVLEWGSIQWAKGQGFRYYDLEGIPPKIAMAKLCGEKIGADLKDHWSCYKFKYGGELKLFPKAHIHLFNPVAKWLCNNIVPVLERQAFQNVLDLVRLR